MPAHNPTSNYTRLGFVTLHIKRDTKDRLNAAKVQLAAQRSMAISHDDLINVLLDQHLAAVLDRQPMAKRA